MREIVTLIKRIYRKVIVNPIEQQRYQRWVENHTPDEAELKKQSEKTFSKMPLYSIVVPLYHTPEKYLEELIQSVRLQSYSRWELILSDGSGEPSPLDEYLKGYVQDERIIVLRSKIPLDISENTNQALKMAKGEYIVFADHDDILPSHALYECTKIITEENEPDMIYTDEDKVTMDGKKYFQPHFKPDFNIDLLRSMNYFCHLVLVKRSLQSEVGFLNAQYNGAQDYDFVLRCAEKASRIYHIPQVLYHWRAHPGSIAGNAGSKEYAFEAGRRALQDHYRRCGIQANVTKGELFGLFHTSYIVEKKPKVSVIVLDKGMLERCITSVLEHTRYPDYELIVLTDKIEIENASSCISKFKTYDHPIHIEPSNDKNYGAKVSNGELLLFLNSNYEVRDPEWMEEFVGCAMRSGVGIVGAHLYQSSGKQQHTGMIVGYDDDVKNIAQGSDSNELGYFGRNICTQEYSVVSGDAMLIKKECFNDIDGFDETFLYAYDDIDVCLKARESGYSVVYDPMVHLYDNRNMEDQGKEEIELELIKKKWKKYFEQGDPFYNPNLTLHGKMFSLKKDC